VKIASRRPPHQLERDETLWYLQLLGDQANRPTYFYRMDESRAFKPLGVSTAIRSEGWKGAAPIFICRNYPERPDGNRRLRLGSLSVNHHKFLVVGADASG
jgi:hypothetical protein